MHELLQKGQKEYVLAGVGHGEPEPGTALRCLVEGPARAGTCDRTGLWAAPLIHR